MDCKCTNKQHGKSGCSINTDEFSNRCTWCAEGCVKRQMKNNP